jgi:hypothetical protein
MVKRCSKRRIRGISYKASKRWIKVRIYNIFNNRSIIICIIFLGIFSFIFKSISRISKVATFRNKCNRLLEFTFIKQYIIIICRFYYNLGSSCIYKRRKRNHISRYVNINFLNLYLYIHPIYRIY